MLENLRELYQYRALLWALTVRELMVRYRGSVFGFLWTFLNPFLLMTVYSLVFSVYMRSSLPNYAYFMFVSLLPWLWFATSFNAGTSAISERRDLISKVKFPPQILPMTVIASALSNYVLTLPLLVGFAAYRGVTLGWPLLAFPLVLGVQLLFTVGLVYVTSTINVMFRDLQHIVASITTLWFFVTPIVYSLNQVPEQYQKLVLALNPLAVIVVAQQDIWYYNRLPHPKALVGVIVLSLVLFAIGSLFMAHRREDFAETA